MTFACGSPRRSGWMGTGAIAELLECLLRPLGGVLVAPADAREDADAADGRRFEPSPRRSARSMNPHRLSPVSGMTRRPLGQADPAIMARMRRSRKHK